MTDNHTHRGDDVHSVEAAMAMSMRDKIAEIVWDNRQTNDVDPDYVADAILAALPDLIAPKVKQLVWEQIDPVTWGTTSVLGNAYTVWAMDGFGYCKFPDGYAGKRFVGGLDEAKAAAQAHHDALIRSALVTPTGATT